MDYFAVLYSPHPSVEPFFSPCLRLRSTPHGRLLLGWASPKPSSQEPGRDFPTCHLKRRGAWEGNWSSGNFIFHAGVWKGCALIYSRNLMAPKTGACGVQQKPFLHSTDPCLLFPLPPASPVTQNDWKVTIWAVYKLSKADLASEHWSPDEKQKCFLEGIFSTST